MPKKYTHEQFVEMFIKLYSKDWGKIKSAYIKQSQDKEPGTIINMPKPEVYLKQILTSYLQQADEPKTVAEEIVPATEVKKPKAPAKKKTEALAEEIIEVKKPKAAAKKKTDKEEDDATEVKKPKAAVKKTAIKK
ncbi:hypothetical protein [Pedobacter nototheniae]|uniref:hypothetical protein n=1 Tax=Pedobacter nototheniae TaxID=2488994 RepID=UPI001B8D9DD8|nr:hypothetical protein [Pedobacter nototheniae]